MVDEFVLFLNFFAENQGKFESEESAEKMRVANTLIQRSGRTKTAENGLYLEETINI